MSPSQNLTEGLNTLSDKVIDTALLKAKENGFDLNKAHIPLQESFQNLISIRSQLADAVEKNKLSQLPFSIQQKFANRLVTVQARLISFANGSDEVINISNDIEDTYVDLYNSRLTELSNEYLGYQARENQLKFLLTKADQLQEVLLEGAKTKEKVDELMNELENQKNRTNDLVKSATENQQGSSDVLAKITEIQQNAAQHSSIAVIHNHPSGNLKPSRADRITTEKLVHSSRFANVRMLDHLIISQDGYFSFSDEGILYETRLEHEWQE